MSEPFLAEIRMVGFNFAPRGWAFCDGQILPINQNQSLYSLLGTTYGGDGRTSLGLPDLRGRAPMHFNGSHPLGQKGGQETHTLQVSEMPAHNHNLNASGAETGGITPGGNVLANAGASLYTDQIAVNKGQLRASTIGTVGGQAHNNMQPTLAIRFCIALRGLFPSRN